MRSPTRRSRLRFTIVTLTALGPFALGASVRAEPVRETPAPSATAGSRSDLVAATNNVALSELLFRYGKELLDGKDYAHACPKLAESFRLDPATGTLLALAVCHERDKKLASAWSEYAEVAARSVRESRQDREKAARQKVATIEPLLSTLTISLAPEAEKGPELEVRRDGVLIAPGALGSALPVDGGAHVIKVSAPGKKGWQKDVSIAVSGDEQRVIVPALENGAPEPMAACATGTPAAAPTTAASPHAPLERAPEEQAPASPAPETPAPAARAPSSLRTAAFVTGAAGIVGLGAGAIFTALAVHKNNASSAGCDGDACFPDAKQDRLDARSWGNVATIAFAGGGALAATGLFLYVLDRNRSPSEQGPSQAARWRAAPVVGSGQLGCALETRF